MPLNGDKITNNQRIVAALPTIKYASEKSAKAIILMSHLGRPGGQRVAKFSLAPVAKELEKLLSKKVTFLDDCVGKEVEERVQKATDGNNCEYGSFNTPKADQLIGEIILLENLRYHVEEEGSSKIDGKKVTADPAAVKAFRTSLTSLGNVYISTSPVRENRAGSI